MDWQSVLKYNPNHDPKDGRFTFAGHGGAPALDSPFERAFRPPPSDAFYAKTVDRYDEDQGLRGLVSDKYAGKSAFAVVKALKEAYPHIKFPQMEEMHPLFLREIATQIDRMAELHPQAFQALDTVGMENTVGSLFQVGNHAGAWAVMTHGHMRFNPRYFDFSGNLVTDARNPQEAKATPTARAGSLLKELSEAHDVGYHPAGCDTVGSVFVHEFGHHVQAFEMGELDYLGARSKTKEFDKRVGSLLVAALHQEVDSDTAISTYSAASDREWFAEAFSYIYSNPKPKPLGWKWSSAEKVKAVFDNYFNDYDNFARGKYAKKEDIAQADLDRGGRLPATQGPKRRRHGFKRMFQYGEGLVNHVTKMNPNHDPKTGRFTTAAKGFMKEWYEGTQPHPFDDRTRLRRYVGVDMSPYPGLDTVHLSAIISFGSKGKGEASQALSEITQMADERGITLDLTAKPIANAGAEGKSLTKAQLIKWYKRHGFVQERYPLGPGLSDRMARKPKLQTSATEKADPVSFKNQFLSILKFNPFHDARGKFTSAQNAKQQAGHDELPTVEAMNRAMQLVGMEAFERAVMDHLDAIGRPVMGAEQAYEIERVARRIVATHRGTVTKCDFSMPISYFYEIGDAYRAFKFDESKHPREPSGTPKGGQFAAWRQGTGMYFDDKVWRYGGDHSEVPSPVAVRLKAMAIPPASINVHLNPDDNEPLQATWTARNGKLQYRYSADAMGSNAAEKFSRLKDFNAAMPLLRRRSHDDMLKAGPQADRDTAAVVRLMAKTGFRVGGAEEFETKKGKAYGASTLLDRHVVVTGTKLAFSFPGKHAVMQNHELNDPLLAQYIRARKRNTPKDERLFTTNEGRVNKYLKDVTGQPFSAKDFRTWHGTHTALTVLKEIGNPASESEYRKARIHVGDVVAKHLGNTRMVALSSYVDPTVWGRWAGKEKKRIKA